MVAMFFIGLSIGLFFSDRVRLLSGRMRNGLRTLFRSKARDQSTIPTSSSRRDSRAACTCGGAARHQASES